MPIPLSILGAETANHVLRDLRSALVRGVDVSAWSAELRQEGFEELADAIDAHLAREMELAALPEADLHPWPTVTARSRSLLMPVG